MHPRCVHWLADSDLEGLGAIFAKLEAAGSDDLLSWILIHLIPKKAGGRRPIGLMTGLLRLWGRARRCLVRDWEAANVREWSWATAGRPCERAVWMHALWDEWGKTRGFESGAVLIDIVKFYEQIPHDILLQEAIAVGFPLPVLRVVLSAYSGFRTLVLEGVSSAPARASRSILAGCFAAVSLGKVIMMRTLDRVTCLWSGIRLRVVVDDVSVQGVSTAARLPKLLVDAVSKLAFELQGRLKLPVSEAKTKVLGSNFRTRREIAQGLTRLGLPFRQASQAEHLGVDFAAGRRLVWRKLSSRIHAVRRRQRQWAILRRDGGSTKKLARTGALPAMIYGTRVHGATGAQLQAIRREVAAAAGYARGRRSITLCFLLDGSDQRNGDPMFQLTWGPLQEWATALWDGSIPIRVLEQVLRNAAHALVGRTRPWARVHGPAGALLLTLRRIGWELSSARTAVDDQGHVIDMLRTAPHELGVLVARAVGRWQHRIVAQELGEQALSAGLRLHPLRRLIRKTPSARERGAIFSTVSGGQCPQARLAQAKLHAERNCRLCDGAVGTLDHRHVACDASQPWRYQWLQHDAIAAGRAEVAAGRDTFWGRLLAPSPGAALPPLCRNFACIGCQGPLSSPVTSSPTALVSDAAAL